jgi:hypothetical protein
MPLALPIVATLVLPLLQVPLVHAEVSSMVLAIATVEGPEIVQLDAFTVTVVIAAHPPAIE